MKFVAPLLLVAMPAFAAAPPLAGDYTHEFTEPADAVVWQVRTAGDAWRVVRTGDGATLAATLLDPNQRERLWRRYEWGLDSSRDAACVAWREADEAEISPGISGVICRLGTGARTDAVSGPASEVFEADAMGGVMEIRRLP